MRYEIRRGVLAIVLLATTLVPAPSASQERGSRRLQPTPAAGSGIATPCSVARHLPNSLHVVVPNGGHGVGGPCIDQMIDALLETARVDGLDVSCVEAAPPTRFRLPESGGR